MKPRFLLPAAASIGVWQLVCSSGAVSPVMLASPWDVAKGFSEVIRVGMPPGQYLAGHAGYSLLRVFTGVALAVLVGVPLGLAIGASRRVRGWLMPLVDFLRPIPPLAWVPLAILWFGLGLASAAYLIFLGAVFPIVLATCSGVRRVDRLLVDAVRMLGASKPVLWLKVYFPAALPAIWTGIRVGMGVGWMTLVAAEFIGVRGGYGLGYMIMSARDLQRTDLVITGMVTIGLIGLAIEWGMARVSSRLIRWQ